MSFKLSELQDIAMDKGPKYFTGDRRMVCLHATLYAINDALAGVDDVIYVPPDVIKASNGLLGGLFSADGSCGIVLGGGIAISMKYGVSNPYENMKVFETGMKARDFYYWFREEFGSCNCCDLSLVTDWSDDVSREWYNAEQRGVCTKIMGKTVRKLVDLLTVNNPNVVRDI
jgi:hypothetical protein